MADTTTIQTNLAATPWSRDYQPLGVDLTPGAGLAVRILTVYLDNCATKWAVEGLSKGATVVYDQMNRDQDRRAELLRAAIEKLK